MKRLLVFLLAIPLVLTAACIDYESGIAFNKDMTGKASFRMAIDMAPFIDNMVGAMAARGGGPPPDEMISMLKTELGTQMGNGMFNLEQIKKTLPAGITLADSSQKLDDLKMVMSFSFAFTDATKLPLVELPAPELPGAAGGASGAPKTPLKPFDTLVFVDDGTTMSITTKEKPAATPTATASSEDAEKAKAAAQSAITQAKTQLDQLGMGDMLKGLSIRMAFRFDVPQTVIEQNATRKEGQSYIWELKLDNFESLDKMPDPPKVKLRFNKK